MPMLALLNRLSRANATSRHVAPVVLLGPYGRSAILIDDIMRRHFRCRVGQPVDCRSAGFHAGIMEVPASLPAECVRQSWAKVSRSWSCPFKHKAMRFCQFHRVISLLPDVVRREKPTACCVRKILETLGWHAICSVWPITVSAAPSIKMPSSRQRSARFHQEPATLIIAKIHQHVAAQYDVKHPKLSEDSSMLCSRKLTMRRRWSFDSNLCHLDQNVSSSA